jgi:hypothetical protein
MKTCGLYYLESNIACRPYKRTVHHRDTGKISRVHQTYLHYHLEVSFKATRALPSRELPHPHAQICDMRVLYFLLYIGYSSHIETSVLSLETASRLLLSTFSNEYKINMNSNETRHAANEM